MIFQLFLDFFLFFEDIGRDLLTGFLRLSDNSIILTFFNVQISSSIMSGSFRFFIFSFGLSNKFLFSLFI